MVESKKDKKIAEKDEFDIKELYTPLSVAKKEIWRRWKDKKLRKKVEKFLGRKVPKPFRKEPRAVLSRSIITPNVEFFHFLDQAKITTLIPLGLEGVEDKFCTKNYDKASLGKLAFFRKGDVRNRIKNIECKKNIVNAVDMMASDGKRLCDVDTLWGESLVDFHHRMLTFYDSDIEKFDDFKWFGYQGKKGDIYKYYKNFFAFFICHGVLFENFITKRSEKEFTNNIVIKSYKEVKDKFGVTPLIVPLLPFKYDDHWYFRSYIEKE
jgi:hypothetical protein